MESECERLQCNKTCTDVDHENLVEQLKVEMIWIRFENSVIEDGDDFDEIREQIDEYFKLTTSNERLALSRS